MGVVGVCYTARYLYKPWYCILPLTQYRGIIGLLISGSPEIIKGSRYICPIVYPATLIVAIVNGEVLILKIY